MKPGMLVRPKRVKGLPVELYSTDGYITMNLNQVGIVIASELDRYRTWVRILVDGKIGDGYPNDFEMV